MLKNSSKLARCTLGCPSQALNGHGKLSLPPAFPQHSFIARVIPNCQLIASSHNGLSSPTRQLEPIVFDFSRNHRSSLRIQFLTPIHRSCTKRKPRPCMRVSVQHNSNSINKHEVQQIPVALLSNSLRARTANIDRLACPFF